MQAYKCQLAQMMRVLEKMTRPTGKRVRARVPTWVCRPGDREAGRACGQGVLAFGMGSFSGGWFLEL